MVDFTYHCSIIDPQRVLSANCVKKFQESGSATVVQKPLRDGQCDQESNHLNSPSSTGIALQASPTFSVATPTSRISEHEVGNENPR